jgi:hypothetical protein
LISPLELFSHALWLFGLSLVLTALSYRSWQATLPGALPQRSGGGVWLNLGLLLFALGLLLLSGSIWERVGWGVVILLLLLSPLSDRLQRRRQPAAEANGGEGRE